MEALRGRNAGQVLGQSQGSELEPVENSWPHAGHQGVLLRRACAGVVAAPLLLGLGVVHQHHVQPPGRQLLEVAQPRRIQVAPDHAEAQVQYRLQDISCMLEQAHLASLRGAHNRHRPEWHETVSLCIECPYEVCLPALRRCSRPAVMPQHCQLLTLTLTSAQE